MAGRTRSSGWSAPRATSGCMVSGAIRASRWLPASRWPGCDTSKACWRPAIGSMSGQTDGSMPFPSESADGMRTLFRLILLLVVHGLCGTAGADSFPDRPVHVVVPFPPGGPAGVVAEVVGPKLGERLGQPVLIEHP